MEDIRRAISRPPRRREPTALPLLPLAAAVLVLMAAGQVGLWAWQYAHRPEAPSSDMEQVLGGNPLRHLGFGERAAPPPAPAAQVRRVTLPTEGHNLQFGNPQARVVATVLSDPACGTCREKVRAWMRALPGDVRVVYKFWPRDPGRLAPGMMMELARREGVGGAFWQLLDTSEGDLNDADLLNLLERAGVPLDRQRAALSDPEARLGEALDGDLRRLRDLEMAPPPVLTIEGYVIDDVALSESRIGAYVDQLKRGEPLTRDSDAWLMRR